MDRKWNDTQGQKARRHRASGTGGIPDGIALSAGYLSRWDLPEGSHAPATDGPEGPHAVRLGDNGRQEPRCARSLQALERFVITLKRIRHDEDSL
jgi:hypothetical protein